MCHTMRASSANPVAAFRHDARSELMGKVGRRANVWAKLWAKRA